MKTLCLFIVLNETDFDADHQPVRSHLLLRDTNTHRHTQRGEYFTNCQHRAALSSFARNRDGNDVGDQLVNKSQLLRPLQFKSIHHILLYLPAKRVRGGGGRGRGGLMIYLIFNET